MIDDSAPALTEIWHPYWKLEEMAYNMWGSVSDRDAWLKRAIEFTADHVRYGEWMRKVAGAWKHSCEHNLTKRGDKRPWIGHAAVAFAIQCPEDIVREAWAYLSEEQQNLANAAAQDAIDYWRRQHA